MMAFLYEGVSVFGKIVQKQTDQHISKPGFPLVAPAATALWRFLSQIGGMLVFRYLLSKFCRLSAMLWGV
jgi:hypothetical protein